MFKGTLLLTDTGVHAFTKNPLSKAESMILWHLVSNLPPAGAIVENAELSKALKITRTRVSQTMKHLCEIGFLIRGTKLGVSYHYKLNPLFIRVLNA